MADLTLTDYSALLKYLAEAHNDIAHDDNTNKRFAIMDIDQLLADKQIIKDDLPYMAGEYFDIDIDGEHSSNLMDAAHSAFIILQNVRQTDTDAMHTALDNCLRIGKEVIGRMYEEKKNIGNMSNPVFDVVKNFDVKSLKVMKVGPLMSNSYGYRFSFKIGAPMQSINWYQSAKFTK